MSDKKPFWEGKTCKEMANLRVKVTFKNGTVATGVTGANGDIKRVFPLSSGAGNDKFIPRDYIKSIELVDESISVPDDPEYERIDDIDDVREGDIFVAKDGNHYPIKHIGDYGLGATFCVSLPYGIRAWLDDSAFSYALRPKPKLPDHDGLWLDKNGKTWVVSESGTTLFDPESLIWRIPKISGVAFGTKSDTAIDLAPFRPAKAVEA